MECCIAFPRRRKHIHLDEKVPVEEAPRPVQLVDPKTEVTEPESRFIKRRDASPPRASTAAESYSSSLLDEKVAVRCPTGLESYSRTEQEEESYSSHRRTTLEVLRAQSQSQTTLEASPIVGTAACQTQRSSAFRSLKRSLEPRTVGWGSPAFFKKMGKGSKSSPSSAASNPAALSNFDLGAELQKREYFDRTIGLSEYAGDYRAVSEEVRRRKAWDEAYGRYLDDR
ncbi:MAG: hypothetical protein M1819_003385 [Sarea resinae]|nr:MAG: hypothetical protein M1819_003385 [Sarea resinae]